VFNSRIRLFIFIKSTLKCRASDFYRPNGRVCFALKYVGNYGREIDKKTLKSIFVLIN